MNEDKTENKTIDTPANKNFLTLIAFFVAGTLSFLIFFIFIAPVVFNNPFTIDNIKIEKIEEYATRVRPDGKTYTYTPALRFHFENGKVCDVPIWSTLFTFLMASFCYFLTFLSYKDYRETSKLQKQKVPVKDNFTG